MKIAIIYNKDRSGVINKFGMQNKEKYNPKTVRLVEEALEQGGHNVAIIDGNMDVIQQLQDFMPRVMEGERMGMVFNMAYGIQGESRYTHLPAMLEMLGIPYVGSTPSGHALALDKIITKIIMQKNGIPTPGFWVFSKADEDMSGVEYPVIVKPKMEAVSYGLRIVDNETDLRDAVKFTTEEFKQQALVEQFIRGREFCVGLLGNNPPEAFPIIEIDLEGNPDAIQSVEDKKKKPREKICPAPISQELADKMVQYTIRAFNALQLRDFSRVDIRMDENENIYLLEINSMASLGRTGAYVNAAAVAGYDYNALINRILDVAAVRYFAGTTLIDKTGEIKGLSQKLPLPVRIRTYISSRKETIEKTLKEMVNTNTYVRNVDGVNHLGSIIKRELSPLGFEHQVYPQIEVGNILLLDNCSDKKYDILLLCHVDNSTTLAKREFFKATEQRIYGTGVWENIGGLAVMIGALQALRFVRMLRKLNIGILLTTDDTLQGRISQNLVQNKTRTAQYILGLKGGGLEGTVISSRSGAAVYSCSMSMKEKGHAEDVSRAVNILSKIVSNWTGMTNEAKGLVVVPTEMNLQSNIMGHYANADILLSIRFGDIEQMQQIDKKIRGSITAKDRKIIRFQIEGGIRRPPMNRNEAVSSLYETIKKIGHKLDIRVLEDHRWSSADICFAGSGKPMIDGMGPLGTRVRGRDEYILRHSLLERSALLALTLLEIGMEKN
ncbi:MAG: M20/M25/M40 family metallo-hydrolase [Acidobacteria bacterium]|nr:M20/M25/M40 family metallo-hydrolase [Acidobacteriota bacterium]